VAIVLIPIAGSGLVTWLINRNKVGAETRLIDMQTMSEWLKSQDVMQKQIDYLSEKLSKTRAEMEEMQTRHEQQIDQLRGEYEAQISALRAEYEGKLSYMRRKINRYMAALDRHEIKLDESEGDL
jgi:flagellar capping protein FliD